MPPGMTTNPGGVDQLVGGAGRAGLGERRDAAVLDHDVGGEHRRVGRHRAAGDHRSLAAHSHRLTLSERLPAVRDVSSGKASGSNRLTGLLQGKLPPTLGV